MKIQSLLVAVIAGFVLLRGAEQDTSDSINNKTPEQRIRILEQALQKEREERAAEVQKLRDAIAELRGAMDARLTDLRATINKSDAQPVAKAPAKQPLDLSQIDNAVTLAGDVWKDAVDGEFIRSNFGLVVSLATFKTPAVAEAKEKVRDAEQTWKSRFRDGKTKLWEWTSSADPRLAAIQEEIRATYETFDDYFWDGSPQKKDKISDRVSAIKKRYDELKVNSNEPKQTTR